MPCAKDAPRRMHGAAAWEWAEGDSKRRRSRGWARVYCSVSGPRLQRLGRRRHGPVESIGLVRARQDTTRRRCRAKWAKVATGWPAPTRNRPHRPHNTPSPWRRNILPRVRVFGFLGRSEGPVLGNDELQGVYIVLCISRQCAPRGSGGCATCRTSTPRRY